VSEKNDFYPPDIQTYVPGDGTLTTTSSLVPTIKWMWENQHKDDLGDVDFDPKPVKIGEYCSTYKQSYNTNEVEDNS